jgi:hypothetical protein
MRRTFLETCGQFTPRFQDEAWQHRAKSGHPIHGRPDAASFLAAVGYPPYIGQVAANHAVRGGVTSVLNWSSGNLPVPGA